MVPQLMEKHQHIDLLRISQNKLNKTWFNMNHGKPLNKMNNLQIYLLKLIHYSNAKKDVEGNLIGIAYKNMKRFVRVCLTKKNIN